MKGVSPVVAGVILISVAVVVGVMVSTWVTNWTSTQTSNTPTCAVNTHYVIDSATFTSSTNETRVKITNRGSEGIYGFEMTVDNGTDILRFSTITESFNTSVTSKLTQGNSIYLSAVVNGTFNKSICSLAKEIRVSNRGCPSVLIKTETITQA
jgi:archaellum component FlaF (FlaF/FlaG flagellin family)